MWVSVGDLFDMLFYIIQIMCKKGLGGIGVYIWCGLVRFYVGIDWEMRRTFGRVYGETHCWASLRGMICERRRAVGRLYGE